MKPCLMGAHYNNDLAFTSNKWTLTSDSRHVVWFAPMPGENKPGGFTQVTTLDGLYWRLTPRATPALTTS